MDQALSENERDTGIPLKLPLNHILGRVPSFSCTNQNCWKMIEDLYFMTSNISCMFLRKGIGLPHRRLPRRREQEGDEKAHQHGCFQATAMLLQTKSGLERSRWSW